MQSAGLTLTEASCASTSFANTCFSRLSWSRRFINLFTINSSSCSACVCCRPNNLLATRTATTLTYSAVTGRCCECSSQEGLCLTTRTFCSFAAFNSSCNLLLFRCSCCSCKRRETAGRLCLCQALHDISDRDALSHPHKQRLHFGSSDEMTP